MNRVLPCMSDTTRLTNTETDECARSLPDQGKRSSCEPARPMLFSFGDASLTPADRRELTALFSETSQQFAARTLSDRLTPLLTISGLVAGITPTSIREKCGAVIPDFVLSLPGGASVEQRNGACKYLSGRIPFGQGGRT
jgi:hypothetical protein